MALDWARALGCEWVWALEDCRHVWVAFERFLVVRGERVVRVATRLMAGDRRGAKERGKPDLIDALAVARVALREGVERLPLAQLAGVELDIRLLVDHRECLVRMRLALDNDLLWRLHDLWPEQTLPGGALLSKKWATRISRRLARHEQSARVRIARDELRQMRELSRTIDALEAELAELVARVAPQLLAEPGFGPLTVGKLIAEIAGAQRFSSDAKLARRRHRTDPRQLRQDQPPPTRPWRLPPDQHRHPPRRARGHPQTRAHIERKRSEGTTNRDAIAASNAT